MTDVRVRRGLLAAIVMVLAVALTPPVVSFAIALFSAVVWCRWLDTHAPLEADEREPRMRTRSR